VVPILVSVPSTVCGTAICKNFALFCVVSLRLFLTERQTLLFLFPLEHESNNPWLGSEWEQTQTNPSRRLIWTISGKITIPEKTCDPPDSWQPLRFLDDLSLSVSPRFRAFVSPALVSDTVNKQISRTTTRPSPKTSLLLRCLLRKCATSQDVKNCQQLKAHGLEKALKLLRDNLDSFYQSHSSPKKGPQSIDLTLLYLREASTSRRTALSIPSLCLAVIDTWRWVEWSSKAHWQPQWQSKMSSTMVCSS